MGRCIMSSSSNHCHTKSSYNNRCKDGRMYICIVSLTGLSCGALEKPIHGTKQGDDDWVGSLVTFTCDTGFSLGGSSQRHCTQAGTWTGTETACTGRLMESSLMYSCMRNNIIVA